MCVLFLVFSVCCLGVIVIDMVISLSYSECVCFLLYVGGILVYLFKNSLIKRFDGLV